MTKVYEASGSKKSSNNHSEELWQGSKIESRSDLVVERVRQSVRNDETHILSKLAYFLE